MENFVFKKENVLHLSYIIKGSPANVFSSTSAYFVNGNTKLMSDLPDN